MSDEEGKDLAASQAVRLVLVRILVMGVLVFGATSTSYAGESRINRELLQARENMASDQPGTSGNAFRILAQKLVAAGYTPVPTHPRDLIGDLPNIVAFIQGKLDAKDDALAAKQAEIIAHADANEFKPAFEDQIMWTDLIRQRCRIQDGYNEIQSWALALLIRKGARQ